MAINYVLSIPRLSDKSLLDCVEKVAHVVSQKQITANLSFFGNGNLTTFDPLNIKNADNEIINSLLQANSALIERLSFSVSSNQGDSYTLNFFRGGVSDPKSPYYDQIRFTESDNNRPTISVTEKLQIAEIVTRELHAFTPDRAISTTPEQTQLQALHEATLDRLEHLNETLIKKTAEYRIELDQLHSAKREGLESEFTSLKNDLYKEVASKEQSIQEKTEQLENQRKELDDRSNTHARREIRKDILREIKSRQQSFKLTDGTNELRKPIMVGIVVLIGVFMLLAGFSVFEFTEVWRGNDYNKIILISIKQAIYTAGAIGSILYLIKWQNRWFEQHATAEFHLKKLELDIERASWVVETTLEWNDVKGTSMPNELLESLTKNLFNENKIDAAPIVHPADQLASALLGSSSSIKLKIGDTAELQVDPKKLSKADPITEEN